MIKLVFFTVYAEGITCPDGFFYVRGGCYQLTHGSANWFDSQYSCQLYDANLTTFNSEADIRWVFEYLKAHGKQQNLWIGLSDISIEGNYVWIDSAQSNASFSYWATNEPSGGSTNCIIQSSSYGFWDDTDCGNSYYGLCKRLPGQDVVSNTSK